MKIQSFIKSVLFIILGFALSSAHPARADVSLSIHFESSPTMLYLDGPGVYAVVGSPYDLFFLDGVYFYFHGGHWYSAVGYNGPWNRSGFKGLPPGLRKNKLMTLQGLRDKEYRTFKAHGSAYKGKSIKAVGGPGNTMKGSKKGPGKGPGMKGGKGKRK